MTRTPIRFTVWDEDGGDEDGATTVQAEWAEAAAVTYAERLWSGDPWEDDEPLHVWVKHPNGTKERYRITVDRDPHFYAAEVR